MRALHASLKMPHRLKTRQRNEGPVMLRVSGPPGSRSIQPPQSACSVRLPVNDTGTWDTHTLAPPILVPEAQAGTLWYASSVEVGATIRASAQADHVLAARETIGAGDGERMPIAGQHFTTPRGPLTLRRSWKNYCGSSVGYGSCSRAARRPAEAWPPGVLVFTSSSRQESQPRETFDKATHAQRTKPHPFPLEQLPDNRATNAPAKCSLPDNSLGVLDNTNTPQQLQCQLARDKPQGWHSSWNADTGCFERRPTLRARSILCNRRDRDRARIVM
ncbi:hypothetical protein HPB50_010561 [Hyalomma asiaticum]|uniref:Uncharacterized protein n=1 Tax=Hyalomma asiaticum TaxID=266040 RepID=A0ACB7RZF5_HYAAI|nr:hypothetical protein HPB50_010561 [Hyalomma asiaticum]